MLKALRAVVRDWQPAAWTERDPARAVAAAWESIVGANVAAHTWPASIDGATLVIGTPSSAWSQQLQFLSGEILSGVRALPEGAGIARLVFRNGLVPRRRARAAAPAGRPERRAAGGMPPGPAGDGAEALERLRTRIATLRRAAPAACAECAAPLERSAAACAPCAGRAAQARAVETQRMLYMAPWLEYAEVRAHVAGLARAEYERARRHLLQRWWLMLERARRTGKLSHSKVERPVASSYVLLHSGLAPDRITPAVINNILGEELAALLWGSGAGRAKTDDR